MSSITWKGLEITGNVFRDPGVHTFRNGDPGYPPSTEVTIDEITVDDEEEFAEFLAEHEKPSEWKTLPKAAKKWLLDLFDETIMDKMAE